MMDDPRGLPDTVDSVEQLEDLLSEPTEGLVGAMGRLEGDLIVLGVGGKMGPTLARMAKRASELAGRKRRVIGVSRFTSEPREALEACGVETIACDLLNPDEVAQLPRVPNVVYMAGLKFGTSGSEARTWAMNTYLPSVVSRHFVDSRIVAFSTGNVYGLAEAASGGSVETDPVNPDGEYAMSCVGRERIFEHFSRTNGTPVALIRLNYAVELRYGVLVDVALSVWERRPVRVEMGYVNVIWQADANAMTLAAFDSTSSPPTRLNVAGREILKIRDMAEEFGRLLDREVAFEGSEASDAILSSGVRCCEKFGSPRVESGRLLPWIAHWVRQGLPSLNKPTHFESRDGSF